MGNVFTGMNISATGMTAQRTRLDIISQNIANVNSTRDADGNVYRRKSVIFEEKNYVSFSDSLVNATGNLGKGVKISQIFEDTEEPLKKVYDPSHPDADEDGYVYYPNVNTVTEMTDMIDASRSYEANVTAFNASKNMQLKALDIGK
ncbi:MAG: flagellar basal body rod protein FlgC [Lachnospiraceae bacterium]|nr:flagellar basal body rod protein FlgC [Lachnospiraceae bacterium]